jgi:hypothetical protein
MSFDPCENPDVGHGTYKNEDLSKSDGYSDTIRRYLLALVVKRSVVDPLGLVNDSRQTP